MLTSASVTRKDQTVTEIVNVQVHDDTAEATLGLWGTLALSPLSVAINANNTNSDVAPARQGWKVGETILLIQAPGWKIGSTVRISSTPAQNRGANVIDISQTDRGIHRGR